MIDLATSASVTIDTPIDEVWNALTTPELIKRWFFGVDTETDWQVGSPLVHRGEWHGKPYEDKGMILRSSRRRPSYTPIGARPPASRIVRSTIKRSPGRSRSATAAPF
jgi:Uncharacterized conserved protein